MGTKDNSIRVLHVVNEVGENEGGREEGPELLEKQGESIQVEMRTKPTDALKRLEKDFDCVVSEYELSEMDGVEFLKKVRENYDYLPFILFASEGSEEVASEAISAGVTDYLVKQESDEDIGRLAETIENAVGEFKSGSEGGDEDFELYKTIVENSDDGIYVFDEDGFFEFVNQRVVDVSGIPRDAWVGEHVSIHNELETLSESEVAAIESAIEILVHSDRDEARIELTPDIPHELETLELRLTPFETEEGSYVIAFSRDITERKKKKEELKRERDRLEEFANIVSQDLMNPLSIAEGRLELAQQESDSKHLNALEDVHYEMGELINNLQTLAQKGEKIEETQPVELEEVVSECWQNMDTENFDLRIRSSSTLQGNKKRIYQLVEKLIENMIEHGKESTTVRTGTLEDDSGFYLEDDGTGIPEKHREEVFKPGYSTKEEGRGFGLNIVTQIADAHGWDVELKESEEGGARFEIKGVEMG